MKLSNPKTKEWEPGLEPCPFCGASDLYILGCVNEAETMFWFGVICENVACRAEGPIGNTREEAIRRWNTRALAHDKVDESNKGV